MQELQSELSRYAERLENDPERLQELEQRINLIHSLRRKYGPSLAEVIAFGEDAQRKLQSLEQRDVEVARLDAELEKVESEILARGHELSQQRHKLVAPLRKAVARQLGDLGFQASHFDIAISTGTAISDLKGQISAAGLDAIEFVFAPNPGEPPRPLRAETHPPSFPLACAMTAAFPLDGFPVRASGLTLTLASHV